MLIKLHATGSRAKNISSNRGLSTFTATQRPYCTTRGNNEHHYAHLKTIKFDHGVFDTVEAFIAAAQPSHSGLDTVITDANHDKLLLTGVTVADLKAHPNDFHLV